MSTDFKKNPAPAVAFVLPMQYYETAKKKLEAVRACNAKGGPIQVSLRTAYENLTVELQNLADPTLKADLKNGHTYGYLSWSPNATAERNGQMIPNHGEIYICVGVYHKDIRGGCLTAATALGADIYMPVNSGTLLLELPA